jgi:hypothetical protein
MSEYQYYEFQAVDRPLGEKERGELRKLSSRAKITPTSFVNHYEWSDFRGDPARLMERYFDLFLYLANWGSRRFSLRLPERMVNAAELKRFLVDDVATIRKAGEHLIVDISLDEMEAEEWDDGSGRLAALAPLRADVLNDLVEAAASAGPAGAVAGPARSAVAKRIRALDEDEKITILTRLYDSDDPHLGVEFRRRVRKDIEMPPESAGARRTVAELRGIAKRLAAERDRAAAEKAEAERLRLEQKQAKARKQRLVALAAKGEAAWREVQSLIDPTNPTGYQNAVALLTDLQHLAREQDELGEFEHRLGEIRSRHERKRRFIERLDAAGLD